MNIFGKDNIITYINKDRIPENITMKQLWCRQNIEPFKAQIETTPATFELMEFTPIYIEEPMEFIDISFGYNNNQHIYLSSDSFLEVPIGEYVVTEPIKKVTSLFGLEDLEPIPVNKKSFQYTGVAFTIKSLAISDFIYINTLKVSIGDNQE